MQGIEARFLDRAVYGPVAILYEFSGNAKRAFFLKKPQFLRPRRNFSYSL